MIDMNVDLCWLSVCAHAWSLFIIGSCLQQLSPDFSHAAVKCILRLVTKTRGEQLCLTLRFLAVLTLESFPCKISHVHVVVVLYFLISYSFYMESI